MARFSLEQMFEIWDDDSGTCLQVGPDRDGIGVLEIRERSEKGDILARITFTKDQANLLGLALAKLTEEE